jgi:hypothetical protein
MSGRRRDARYRLAIPQAGWLRLAVIETNAGPAFDRDRTSALPVRLLDVSLTGCLLESSRPVPAGVAGELVVVLGGRQLREVVRTTRCDRPHQTGSFRIGAQFEGETPRSAGRDRSLRSAVTSMQDRRTDAVFVDQT